LLLAPATIGVGLALIGVTQLFVPGPLRVPLMIAFALLIGVGNSMAGMQMMTFFGSRLSPDEFAAVLRLRLTLITAASMIAAAAGPWAFQTVGTVWIIVGCGLAISAVSASSLISRTHDLLELVPRPIAAV
jgi:hypothetical protein